MSDERFDRDLTEVLREIAGEEAPMSLRNRLSDITERAPMGRRLWFATPLRLGMVAAAAVAVLALAIVFWPSTDVGPEPSASPTPTPAASPSVEPSPSAEPSVEPTAEPTIAPTAAPTPTPVPTSPSPTGWTGLVWSEPVTPSTVIHLSDLVAWGDGYVAGGREGAGTGRPAFFASPDGLNWSVTSYAEIYRDYSGVDRWPQHLVVYDARLLAFSGGASVESASGLYTGPRGWVSTDGSSWSRRIIESESWQAAWNENAGVPDTWILGQQPIEWGLADVAAGPGAVVVIGNSYGPGGMVPIVLRSADARSWTLVDLPAGSDSPVLNSVVSHDGRFVITGAVGVGSDPTTADDAAWYSDDGIAWTRASVDDDGIGPNVGTEFGPLYAGADGLLTCRGNREMGAGGWRYMMEWLSTDGTSWSPAPNLDQNPGCSWAASDGSRIVSLGPRAVPPPPWPGITAASMSVDGETWQSMTLSETIGDMLERYWVVTDGVIYAGEQSFWFGTAVEP